MTCSLHHETLAGRRMGAGRRARLVLCGAALTIALCPGTSAGQDAPAVTVDERDGLYRVAATFSVPQPPPLALATLTDYDGIPRFMPEVRTSRVIERTAQRVIVEQEAVARFLLFSKRVHLVLEVEHDQHGLRFRDRSGKSFASYEGSWTLSERDGGTAIAYALAARPSFDVPEFLLKRLMRRDAAEMIARLSAEIGARGRSTP